MTYMSRNPQVASVVLDDITTTTPSNPPSGKVKVVDRNGTLFVRNSSGAESAIGTNSSVGSGEKNYIENPSAAASVSGWSNVGDLDVVRTATAADLPRENTTKTGIKITADSNTQSAADYVYYDFTLDDVDAAGRIMKIKWDQKVTGTYTAGQLEVVITTQADRTTAVATPFTSAIPASDGTFQTYFIAPSTATCSLVIRATADMTTDGGIVISDVVVGPNVQVQGSAIGAWKAFTPTGSWTGATATYTGFYREVGDSIEVEVKVSLSGAPTSASLTVNLPSGYTLNTTKVSTDTVVGSIRILDSGTAYFFGQVIAVTSTPSLVRMATTLSNSNFGMGDLTQVAPITFANGDAVWARFSLPVNELSSNVTLANRAVEEYVSNSSTSTSANDTTSFAYGLSGSQIQNITAALSRRVRFTNPIQSTDLISVEVSTDRLKWTSIDSGSVVVGGTTVYSLINQNTTSYGMGRVSIINSTDVDILFGTYGQPTGATFGSAGEAWSSGAGAGYWRVRKVSGGASVGYPISSANIVGRTDGVAPATGMVGSFETTTGSSGTGIITYKDSSTTQPGNGSFVDVLSRTLNKGVYIICAATNITPTVSDSAWYVRITNGTSTITQLTYYAKTSIYDTRTIVQVVVITQDGTSVRLSEQAGNTSAASHEWTINRIA